MNLNLGCSDAALGPPWINVDICEPADVICDLREEWPWPDSSVDHVNAVDIFEHLPDKIHTLNECYRVLKPDGTLFMIVPTTDGRGAWQDPTHCSYWNQNSLFYLEHNNPHNTRFANAYGIKHQFRIVSLQHDLLQDQVWKLRAVLEAVK